jgi:hypothetical protein
MEKENEKEERNIEVYCYLKNRNINHAFICERGRFGGCFYVPIKKMSDNNNPNN